MGTGPSLERLSFTVFGHISRPCAEVYEAVADPAQLSQYFTTGGAQGRLEAGAEVIADTKQNVLALQQLGLLNT